MAYTLIASSPLDSNIGLYLDTTNNTVAFSVDGGATQTDLVGVDSRYKSYYTGTQIDSGTSIALSLTNWPILNQITSSAGNYYIGGQVIATVSNGNIPGVIIPLANGDSAGTVKQSPQIAITDGVPTLITSNVSALWANIQDKVAATDATPGIVQFATSQQAAQGIASNVAVTPAQLAANTVKTINNATGTVVISGAGGIQVTPTTGAGSTTIVLSNTAQGLTPAPADGQQYVQKNGEWSPFTIEGTLLDYTFNVVSGVVVGATMSGSSAIFTLAQFGNPDYLPEFDLINANGYNISYDSKYTYRWDTTTSNYIIACSGGWSDGKYTLKTRGLPGPAYTLNNISDYNPSAGYNRGDLITSGGQVFQAVQNAAPGVGTSDVNVWHMVVASGASGATPVISAGVVETLAPEDPATVEIVSSSGVYYVDFGIPRGSDGAPGSGGSGIAPSTDPTTINGHSGAIILQGGSNVYITSEVVSGETIFTINFMGGGSGIGPDIILVGDFIISSGGSVYTTLRTVKATVDAAYEVVGAASSSIEVI